MTTFRPSRRTVLFGAAAAGATAVLPAARSATAAQEGTPLLLVGDQARERILLLDPQQTWDPENNPDCVRWSFTPVGDDRYADMEPDTKSWKYVSEAKVRTRGERTYVLTTASYGFAAVVEYPSGDRYWGGTLSRGTTNHNPHSMELLPDGNVAVACTNNTDGGIIRLYAASQSPTSEVYGTATLKSAHGLQWDDEREVLWALGDTSLVSYRIGGTAANPTLTLASERELPSVHGHDLTQVSDRPDRLWVTTGSEVWQYDKTSDTFVKDYPDASTVDRGGVKAVGTDPGTGQVAMTWPDGDLDPNWWTRSVHLRNPEDTRELANGGIYKARWWLP